MVRRLATSVVARETEPVNPDRPELGNTITREETFLAGAALPKWAQKVVGDHVYDGSEDDGEPEPEDAPEAPAGNASLEAWQQYATSQGATAEDIDGKSRDDLRARYGA